MTRTVSLIAIDSRPRPLAAANWKMNCRREDGLKLALSVAERAAHRAPACEVAVCPPATLLAQSAAAFARSAIALGAQDCHAKPSGAHTGDISAEMLADVGCRYVIVGHSERRTDRGEDDAEVRAKAAAAHRAGLSAIVCIGESAAERDAGGALAVVERQLKGSLPPGTTPTNTVIAYEPMWAVGTGRTPKPHEIAELHGHLRRLLAALIGPQARALRILYGGSVKADNAAQIFAVDNVDGALVGGASLDAASLWAIVETLDRLKAG